MNQEVYEHPHPEGSDGEIDDYIEDAAGFDSRPDDTPSMALPGGDNHQYMARIFEIHKPMLPTFMTLISLCDPQTQPEETDEDVLSLDVLTDVFIGLLYAEESRDYNIIEESESDLDEDKLESTHSYVYDDSEDPAGPRRQRVNVSIARFNMAMRVAIIVKQILQFLGPTDRLQLSQYAPFDEDGVSAEIFAYQYPLRDDFYNLTIAYMMVCVLLNTLRKLFPDEENNNDFNLAKNPFTPLFTELYAVYTRIVFNCLQIDRYLEEEAELTPAFVNENLKGSSLVKHILAYILNYSFGSNPNEEICFVEPDYYDDIHNESLLELYLPPSRRKLDGGSLVKHVEYYNLCDRLLTLFLPEEEVQSRIPLNTDIMNDKFDEDLRYMFYNSDDEHDSNDKIDAKDDVETEVIEPLNEHLAKKKARRMEKKRKNDEIHSHRGYNYQRDYSYDLGDGMLDQAPGEDYDERYDRPRGINRFFQEEDFSDQFTNRSTMNAFYSIEDFKKNLLILILYPQPVSPDDEKYLGIAEKLLRTISGRIAAPECFEDGFSPGAYLFSEATNENLVSKIIEKTTLTPVLRIKYFELLMVTNPEVAMRMFDELLMEPGERKINIWMLCHEINLSNHYLDYIYSLATQIRNYRLDLSFSRKGNAAMLTLLETSMIIHEFFEGAGEFLSAAEGIDTEEGYQVVLSEAVCNKYVILICLMIDRFIDSKILSEKTYPNLLVITRFLFGFMGTIPQARKTYFRVTNLTSNAEVFRYMSLKNHINTHLLSVKDGKEYLDDCAMDDAQTKFAEKIQHVMTMITAYENIEFPLSGGSKLLPLIQMYLNTMPTLSTQKDFAHQFIKLNREEEEGFNKYYTLQPEGPSRAEVRERTLSMILGTEKTESDNEDEHQGSGKRKKKKKKKKTKKKH